MDAKTLSAALDPLDRKLGQRRLPRLEKQLRRKKHEVSQAAEQGRFAEAAALYKELEGIFLKFATSHTYTWLTKEHREQIYETKTRRSLASLLLRFDDNSWWTLVLPSKVTTTKKREVVTTKMGQLRNAAGVTGALLGGVSATERGAAGLMMGVREQVRLLRWFKDKFIQQRPSIANHVNAIADAMHGAAKVIKEASGRQLASAAQSAADVTGTLSSALFAQLKAWSTHLGMPPLGFDPVSVGLTEAQKLIAGQVLIGYLVFYFGSWIMLRFVEKSNRMKLLAMEIAGLDVFSELMESLPPREDEHLQELKRQLGRWLCVRLKSIAMLQPKFDSATGADIKKYVILRLELLKRLPDKVVCSIDTLENMRG
jgi:hypothetical protein